MRLQLMLNVRRLFTTGLFPVTAPTLDALIGEELGGIHFVRDYVEFYFDGPVVRALSNPVVLLHGRRIAFPDAGSRDARCTLIGQPLASLTLTDDVELRLEFANHAVVTINLDPMHAIGPECMHFMPGRGAPMQVW